MLLNQNGVKIRLVRKMVDIKYKSSLKNIKGEKSDDY